MEHKSKKQRIFESKQESAKAKMPEKLYIQITRRLSKDIYNQKYSENQELNLDFLRQLPNTVSSEIAHHSNSNGDTLLHIYSSLIGKTVEVQYLLEIGVDPKARNRKGETPILLAGQRGNFEAFEELFLHGGYYNADSYGPLDPVPHLVSMPSKQAFEFYKKHIAKQYQHFLDLVPYAINGNIRFLRYLLSKLNGDQMNSLKQMQLRQKVDLLNVAARLGHKGHLQLLIESDFDINEMDKLYNTPMHYVAMHGHLDCIKLLLNKGARWRRTDVFRNAVEHNQLEVARYLIGQAETIEDLHDGESLLAAAVANNSVPMVELLIEHNLMDVDDNDIQFTEDTLPEIVELIENKRKTQEK